MAAGDLQVQVIGAVQFVLLSDAEPLPGAAVSVAFDHVVFTHNKPYQP